MFSGGMAVSDAKPDILKPSMSEIDSLCYSIASQLVTRRDSKEHRVFGVPRGGLLPAAMVVNHILRIGAKAEPCFSVRQATAVVDDVIDSGATAERYADWPFFALYGKTPVANTHIMSLTDRWIVFPWEGSEEGSTSDIVIRFLQRIGEDPNRPGLVETPARVSRAWETWFGGYQQAPAEVLKTFEDGAENVNEMVLVKDIPVYSHCEHHLAPFFGIAHVAYIPNGKIVGLSKLVRVVDILARRLQVQERLTNQIADVISDVLSPIGVGVVMECRHMCMESRGVQRAGVTTKTSALRGQLFESPLARSEFFSLVR